MKRFTLSTVMVALSIMIFATAVFAQGQPMWRMEGLNLNDEQKAKMAELRVKNQIEMVELRAEVKKLHLMIKQELMKPEPSKKQILALVDKINAVKEKIATKRVEHLFKVKSILTPEQWKVFVSRFHLCGDGMHGGKGCGGGCRGMMGAKKGARPCPGEGKMMGGTGCRGMMKRKAM